MYCMSLFDDIINQKIKDWDCPELMSSANRARSAKIPFSSPLLQYSTYGGVPRNKITEFYGEPGGGKAQPLYSKILTVDKGWVYMKDIETGCRVLDGQGAICEIDGVYPQGLLDVYRIIFSDGTYIDVADSHLNVVWVTDTFSSVEVATRYCITTIELIEKFKDGQYKCSIDTCQIDFSNHVIHDSMHSIYDEYCSIPVESKKCRTIVEIRYIGKVLCQCIHVNSDEHTYVTDNFTVTHNTTTAVDICKNAIDNFAKEHEDRLLELRKLAGNGNKGAKAELADLEESGPRKVLYIDLEHSFDNEWSRTLGIDDSTIHVMQPPNVVAEDVLQTLQELVETNEVGLIVLDSLPSLVPRSELEKKYGERTVASLAGLLTVFCRKIVPMLTRYQCTLIFINQIRQNMDNPYVVKTPGGEAPKFYASLRIQFQIGNPIDILGNELPKSTENPAGYIINAKITKQKSAPNDRKLGSYFLMCNSGIRVDMDYAQLAIKKYGYIKKSAGWFTFIDPRTGEVMEEDGKPLKINGLARVYDYLQNHPEYFQILSSAIDADISGQEDLSDGRDPDEIL